MHKTLKRRYILIKQPIDTNISVENLYRQETTTTTHSLYTYHMKWHECKQPAVAAKNQPIENGVTKLEQSYASTRTSLNSLPRLVMRSGYTTRYPHTYKRESFKENRISFYNYKLGELLYGPIQGMHTYV